MDVQRPRRVLCLTLSLGGGARAFLDDYVQEAFADAEEVWVLQPMPPAKFPATSWLLYDGRDDARCIEIPCTRDTLVAYARQIGVTETFVNHLLGFDPDEVAAAFAALGVPYTVFLHDYTMVCANFSLGCQARSCGAAEWTPACREAFDLIGLGAWTLARYRAAMHAILAGAARVLAPTHYAAGIVQAAYPDVAITVRTHRIPFAVPRTFQAAFAEARPLTLAMVGAIWEIKGETWLLYLRDVAEREHLPVRLIAVGEAAKRRQPGIFYTGPYERENLAHLLAEQRVAVVLCPSACPETYCYTASEAMLAGYPVLTMNLGAQAVRVQQTGAGWVLPQDTREAGEAALAAWLRGLVTPKGRRDIIRRAEKTVHFVNGREE